MALARVLVVEDDAAIRRGLCDCLRFAGYVPSEAADGRAGLDAACAMDVDLVLLDLLMPRLDGLTVLAEVRKAKPGLPVIILTAKGEEGDKVKGLKLGADDYVVKPFSASELLARVEAVLRRSAERPTPVKLLRVGSTTIDLARREVRHGAAEPGADEAGQTPQLLSEKEAGVLQYLASNAGRAISRDELLSRVWGLDPRGMHTRAVDMAVARLREVLRDDADSPRFILTVRGKGYMLSSEASPDRGALQSASGPGGGSSS